MAQAQAFHPGLFSDSAMFIDDEFRIASSPAYVTNQKGPVSPFRAAAISGHKLSCLKVRDQRVRKPVDVGSFSYGRVRHIEPVTLFQEGNYTDTLELHIINFVNAPLHADLLSQLQTWSWGCGYYSSTEPFVLTEYPGLAQCSHVNENYLSPLLKRVSGFGCVGEADDENDDLSASPETVKETVSFILHLVPSEFRRPGAALGDDGSIALVWQDDETYITAVFYGTGTYSYVARRQKKTLAAGSSESDKLSSELSSLVRQYFLREES